MKAALLGSNPQQQHTPHAQQEPSFWTKAFAIFSLVLTFGSSVRGAPGGAFFPGTKAVRLNPNPSQTYFPHPVYASSANTTASLALFQFADGIGMGVRGAHILNEATTIDFPVSPSSVKVDQNPSLIASNQATEGYYGVYEHQLSDGEQNELMLALFNPSGDLSGPPVPMDASSLFTGASFQTLSQDPKGNLGVSFLGTDSQGATAAFGVYDPSQGGFLHLLSVSDSAPSVKSSITLSSTGVSLWQESWAGSYQVQEGIITSTIDCSGLTPTHTTNVLLTDPNVATVVSSYSSATQQLAFAYQTLDESLTPTIKLIFSDGNGIPSSDPITIAAGSSPQVVNDPMGNTLVAYLDNQSKQTMLAAYDQFNRLLAPPQLYPNAPQDLKSARPTLGFDHAGRLVLCQGVEASGGQGAQYYNAMCQGVDFTFLYQSKNAPTTLSYVSGELTPIADQVCYSNEEGVFPVTVAIPPEAGRLTAVAGGGKDPSYNTTSGVLTVHSQEGLSSLQFQSNSGYVGTFDLTTAIGKPPLPFFINGKIQMSGHTTTTSTTTTSSSSGKTTGHSENFKALIKEDWYIPTIVMLLFVLCFCVVPIAWLIQRSKKQRAATDASKAEADRHRQAAESFRQDAEAATAIVLTPGSPGVQEQLRRNRALRRHATTGLLGERSPLLGNRRENQSTGALLTDVTAGGEEDDHDTIGGMMDEGGLDPFTVTTWGVGDGSSSGGESTAALSLAPGGRNRSSGGGDTAAAVSQKKAPAVLSDSSSGDFSNT